MEVRALSVDGAWVLSPVIHTDDRGRFLEWFRPDALEAATGHRLEVAQANTSVSAAGTLRGVHFAQPPPGQAKYVTCTRGSVLDVVVDLRVGSPTFGAWEAVDLDAVACEAVFLSEGLGHAFMATSDDAVVTYLCSTTYSPGREHTVDPFDTDLAITWPERGRDGSRLAPRLSPRDAAAPSLREAREQGLLPLLATLSPGPGSVP